MIKETVTRRKLIQLSGAAVALAGATLAGVALYSARGDQEQQSTPLERGWSMPAEWAPHARTWMAWPTPERLDELAEATYRALALLARTIAQFEPVIMLASQNQLAQAAHYCGTNVKVISMPVNDLWIRDTGPTFLVNRQNKLAGTRWRFNAWGEKHAHYEEDAKVNGRILDYLKVPDFAVPLVSEGGALSVDGEGTVLTTETVLLNPNRNPGVKRTEIEKRLHNYLGTRKVVWLPGSTADEVTNGHVDGIATFVRPGVVIAELSSDPQDPEYHILQENLRALKLAQDVKGRSLEVVTIERPPADERWSNQFAASYVNFYLVNGAVIMPEFGKDKADLAARKIIEQVFPGRKVAQVRIDAIAEGGGGIHCATQQQPLATL